MNEHTTGFAPVENGELYYEAAGEGPAVVLIHAGIADHRMWDDQFAAFAERFRVVRYDARGYGRSRTQDTEFSNRQDIADLLDHLGIEQAAVIGVSRGGMIALDFALEFPARTTALVHVAAAFSGEGPDLPEEYASPVEAQLCAEMEEASEKGDLARLTDLEVRFWVDGPGQPETRVPSAIREKVRGMIEDFDRRVDGKATPWPLDPPASARFAEVRVPTLVIYGDRDEQGTQFYAAWVADHVPGARKVVFPGCAHMLSMEQPEEFNRLVLEFLAGA